MSLRRLTCYKLECTCIFSVICLASSVALTPPPPSPLSKDGALHVSLMKYQWTLLIHVHEKQYLVTDIAGKGKTQHRRDHSWLFWLFARMPGKSVDQSEHTIYKSVISKQRQTTVLHRIWVFFLAGLTQCPASVFGCRNWYNFTVWMQSWISWRIWPQSSVF